MSSFTLRAAKAILQEYRLGLSAVTLLCVLHVGNAPVAANFDQRVLAAHNVAREQLGIRPLRWNDRLAGSAAAWADQLAASHRFEHIPQTSSTPEGENLWEGSKGYYPPETMVEAWSREKKYFKPGTFPDNSTTGNVNDVIHFTQLAWRNTTDVGCALARNGEDDILVCRYLPAGNYIGEAPF